MEIIGTGDEREREDDEGKMNSRSNFEELLPCNVTSLLCCPLISQSHSKGMSVLCVPVKCTGIRHSVHGILPLGARTRGRGGGVGRPLVEHKL